MSKSIVTAATVREFYRANEKRMARLPEAAQATVREGARGRLHPKVIADYNKGRKNRYELGASFRAKADALAAREALRAKGVEVGTRGPLPKQALAQSKG